MLRPGIETHLEGIIQMNSIETLQPAVAGRVSPRQSSPGEIPDLVRELADVQRSLLDPATHEAGLNEARYSVLRELRFRQSEGCSQSELARGLYLSESNLSTLLDRMVRDGLLERERSRLDRRKSIIRITSRGAALAEDIRRHEDEIMQRLWNIVSDSSQVTIREELVRAIRQGAEMLAPSIVTSDSFVPMPSPLTSEDQHAAAG